MAAEIQRLASFSTQVLGDFQASVVKEAMDATLNRLDKLAIWLDHHDILETDTVSDLFVLHKTLSLQVEDIERSRAAARRRFNQ